MQTVLVDRYPDHDPHSMDDKGEAFFEKINCGNLKTEYISRYWVVHKDNPMGGVGDPEHLLDPRMIHSPAEQRVTIVESIAAITSNMKANGYQEKVCYFCCHQCMLSSMYAA